MEKSNERPSNESVAVEAAAEAGLSGGEATEVAEGVMPYLLRAGMRNTDLAILPLQV